MSKLKKSDLRADRLKEVSSPGRLSSKIQEVKDIADAGTEL